MSASNMDSPASSSDSKKMSRNEIFTPMIAYDQDKTDPSLYMASRKNVPNALRESFLSDFLGRVSVDYHRNASCHQATNNGGRPLARQEVDDRIRQRAITLVGGGFVTALGSSGGEALFGRGRHAAKQKRTAQSFSKRKFKKRLVSRKNEHLGKERASGSTQKPTVLAAVDSASASATTDAAKREAEAEDSSKLFEKLNAAWHEYAQNLLGTQRADLSAMDSKSLHRLASRMASAELVGANVRVLKCPSNPSLVEKDGVAVETTKNCWKIAIPKQVRCTLKGSVASSKTVWKLSIVQKRGSRLRLDIRSLPFHLIFSGSTSSK